ncbi:DUF5105 domain-containing protein [Bacillus sp. Hm123]|uniref:DUF5105 domain-containing protein n=1 Tax=Bacillus sp. Hm123 TaxID=3450745 RepID=UPI003F436EBD
MKGKLGTFTLMIVIMTVLAACSSEGKSEGPSGKSKVMEASVENASYILAGEDGEVSESQERGLLLVKFKIKNLSKESIDVSIHRNIKLYDGDEQLEPVIDLYSRDVDLELLSNGDVGAGKEKPLLAAFEVEKDKQYEIGVQPTLKDYSKEAEEVKIKLDTKEYAESYDTLQDPAKALVAYIDTIYLGKENVDYEKYVSADKTALQQEAKSVFKERVESLAYDTTMADADIEKYYNSYKSALNQKATIEATTVANANDQAVVHLEYSTVPLQGLSEAMLNLKKEYNDNNPYDSEKSEQYALSKFDVMVNGIEVKSARDPLKIKMVKKDGKWTVDTSDHYSEYLVEAFADGSVY